MGISLKTWSLFLLLCLQGCSSKSEESQSRPSEESPALPGYLYDEGTVTSDQSAELKVEDVTVFFPAGAYENADVILSYLPVPEEWLDLERLHVPFRVRVINNLADQPAESNKPYDVSFPVSAEADPVEVKYLEGGESHSLKSGVIVKKSGERKKVSFSYDSADVIFTAIEGTAQAERNSGTNNPDGSGESGDSGIFRFTYTPATGGEEFREFVVPDGVTSIRVKAWGAGGGAAKTSSAPISATGYGGSGAFGTSEVTVTPGETLHLVIGKGGGTATSTPNGKYEGDAGLPGLGSYLSGEGGGYTSVRRQVGTLLVVAGGGGGASGNYHGESALDSGRMPATMAGGAGENSANSEPCTGGGGGGGYGGGPGGKLSFPDCIISNSAGKGGGTLSSSSVSSAGPTAPMKSDEHYQSGVANGSTDTNLTGGHGMIVIIPQ